MAPGPGRSRCGMRDIPLFPKTIRTEMFATFHRQWGRLHWINIIRFSFNRLLWKQEHTLYSNPDLHEILRSWTMISIANDARSIGGNFDSNLIVLESIRCYWDKMMLLNIKRLCSSGCSTLKLFIVHLHINNQ